MPTRQAASWSSAAWRRCRVGLTEVHEGRLHARRWGLESPRRTPSSRTELLAEGRARAREIPPSELAALATGGRDPLGILARQNIDRDPELVPLRIERMSESPFTFYRGSAAVMAADLAASPHSGVLVASCGDAHVSNFGFYASPSRRLVFDLNDFDEAAWAPWEWDVKRLVTSVLIGGAASARDGAVVERAARQVVKTYLGAIRRAIESTPLERYFAHFDIEASRDHLDDAARRAIKKAVKDAQKRTGERAVRRITEEGEDGIRRIILRPPTTVPPPEHVIGLVHELFQDYRRSTSHDIALLFEHFSIVDIARRVVGVGSVGTRCYLVLLQDGDGNAMLMQPKQASRSVLAEYGRVPQPKALEQLIHTSGEGARVVALQRILQALSDPFLGHIRSPEHDFYARQFHDMKGGIDVEDLEDEPFVTYAVACAAVLARAHAQSRPAPRIIGYAGDGEEITDAILEWSSAYAARSRADWEAFTAGA